MIKAIGKFFDNHPKTKAVVKCGGNIIVCLASLIAAIGGFTG